MMRLVLIGLPTAGKSTLSHRIAVATDVPQVNVGHCLRTAAANDAALGETLARARHVDDGIAADAVRAGLADASGYVLDGYPRSTAQLAVFDGWPAARDCRFVLLDLEPDIVRRRFLARMNCAACRRADYGSGLPRTCSECRPAADPAERCHRGRAGRKARRVSGPRRAARPPARTRRAAAADRRHRKCRRRFYDPDANARRRCRRRPRGFELQTAGAALSTASIRERNSA